VPQIDEFIDPILASDPPAIEGSFELKGESYPIVRSQPITTGAEWDEEALMVELWSVYLADLGHGMHVFPTFTAASAGALMDGHWITCSSASKQAGSSPRHGRFSCASCA
jgi:hypothetical protein